MKTVYLPLLFLAFWTSNLAGQSLISITDSHDLIFDGTRDLLYITTDSGNVERFDINSESLLSAFSVGIDLSGGDITSDGSFLYVGEEVAGATQSIIRKVNLSTGSRTNLTYDQESLESGAWDIVITSNNQMFTTGRFAGSGWVPMREWDLASDTIVDNEPYADVRQRTHLHRSFDRNHFLGLESNSSGGPIFSYDVVADLFDDASTGSSLSSAIGATSRNGDFFILRDSILNNDFSVFDLVPYEVGGAVFDPLQDVVYIADHATDQLIGYDFVNGQELFAVSIGEDIGSSGSFPPREMTISDDGKWIFMVTDEGVRYFANTASVPEPSTFGLLVMIGGLTVLRRRR